MPRKIKRILSAALAVAALVVLCILGYSGLRFLERTGDPTYSVQEPISSGEEDGRPQISLDGAWYALRDDVETVLVIGLDKFQQELDQSDGYRNQQQSDFLALLVLDPAAQKCTALQIDRDTMARIHMLGVTGDDVGNFEGQLALAHTYGTGGVDSGRNTVRAVSEFLYGTQIDHFISFTMDAVSVLNDSVGGVPVEVLQDFSSIDPTMTQGAQVTLRGDQALLYVRERKDLADSSNAARMVRQRQYLTALYGRLLDSTRERVKRADLVMRMSPYLISDCSAQQLYDLADKLSSYSLDEIRYLEGESRVGEQFMEFYPDEQALVQQLIDLLYEPVEE